MKSREFGLDFYYVEGFRKEASQEFPCNYYADGRQAVITLIRDQGWNRIWIPQYFCYDIVGSIAKTGIKICFYEDYPTFAEDSKLPKLKFEMGDVLLRMNFFGLRRFRSNRQIPIPVIEDHSHDLIGDWAKNSDADWCFASLRKSLPIPEGGILWSPKGLTLPSAPKQTIANGTFAKKRWLAMKQKRIYIQSGIGEQAEFRKVLWTTEDEFENLPISAIDPESLVFLKSFDIQKWYNQKNANWKILSEVTHPKIKILRGESGCNYFTFSFLVKTPELRSRLIGGLMREKIYPIVLWRMPETHNKTVDNFSRRILCIPCDSRYDTADMKYLKTKLEKILSRLE